MRVAANPWPLGPGWFGDDVRIGAQSEVDISTLTPEEIAKRWNTDDPSMTAPYGNTRIQEIENKFCDLAEEMGSTIPLNVGALHRSNRPLGGRPHIAEPQQKQCQLLTATDSSLIDSLIEYLQSVRNDQPFKRKKIAFKVKVTTDSCHCACHSRIIHCFVLLC